MDLPFCWPLMTLKKGDVEMATLVPDPDLIQEIFSRFGWPSAPSGGTLYPPYLEFWWTPNWCLWWDSVLCSAILLLKACLNCFSMFIISRGEPTLVFAIDLSRTRKLQTPCKFFLHFPAGRQKSLIQWIQFHRADSYINVPSNLVFCAMRYFDHFDS